MVGFDTKYFVRNLEGHCHCSSVSLNRVSADKHELYLSNSWKLPEGVQQNKLRKMHTLSHLKMLYITTMGRRLIARPYPTVFGVAL